MAFLETAVALLRTPTAPFQEHWMLLELERQLAGIGGLEIKRDEWGNVCARLRRGDTPPPPVAYVAHLDHPGFNIVELDGHRVLAHFEGGVNDGYFLGTGVRLFRGPDDPGVTGTIIEDRGKAAPREARTVLIETNADPTGATLAMWDLPTDTVEGDRLHSRAIDDLGGCACMLETLRAVAARPEPVDLICLFTRAEEVGFRGTLCLCLADDAEDFLPRNSWVISVETSSARVNTPIGGGAVLRVGDRMTIFDPVLTGTMHAISQDLASRGVTRPLVRALMDGGSCEATAFNLFGWTSGGVCLPLGNYHNMNQETKRIDAEYISLEDADSLVQAMTALAIEGRTGTRDPNARNHAEFLQLAENARPRLKARPT